MHTHKSLIKKILKIKATELNPHLILVTGFMLKLVSFKTYSNINLMTPAWGLFSQTWATVDIIQLFSQYILSQLLLTSIPTSHYDCPAVWNWKREFGFELLSLSSLCFLSWHSYFCHFSCEQLHNKYTTNDSLERLSGNVRHYSLI